MNISFQTNHVACRYEVAQNADAQGASAQEPLSEVEGALPQDAHDGVSKPAEGLAGLPKDSPGDVLKGGKSSQVGGFGLGLNHTIPGVDLLGGSILSDLATGLSGKTIGDAQGMANGEMGAGSVSPSVQDLLNQSIDQWGGAMAEGPIARGTALGGMVGCVAGMIAAKAPNGCIPGAAVGAVIGGAIGLVVDVASSSDPKGGSCPEPGASKGKQDTSKPDASVGSSSESKPDDSSKTEQDKSCNPLTQCCPGQPDPDPCNQGMGDDQDSSGAADPFLTSIALSRLAAQGNAAAKQVIAVGTGHHGEMVPGRVVQPDTEDRRGQGQSNGVSLGGVSRQGDDFEGANTYQLGGAAPPRSLEASMKASITNPVVNPIQC